MMTKNFRKFFHFGKSSLSVELVFNGITIIGAGVSFNPDERAVTGGLHLWPLGIYLSLEGPWLKKVYKKLKMRPVFPGYNFGFGISKGGVLNIDVGQISEHDEARSLVYFELAEFLGRKTYREDENEKGDLTIEMPEGEYKGKYRTFTSYWKRALWFESKLRRISIELDTPVPIPGKGESAHDLDDDAVHGVTMPFAEGQDLTDAKIAFINSINHHRFKHGGKDWKPSRKVSRVSPKTKRSGKSK